MPNRPCPAKTPKTPKKTSSSSYMPKCNSFTTRTKTKNGDGWWLSSTASDDDYETVDVVQKPEQTWKITFVDKPGCKIDFYDAKNW